MGVTESTLATVDMMRVVKHICCESVNNDIIKVFISGLNLAFDRGNLTDYFASRLLHVRIFLIATNLATKVKSIPAVFAQAFAPSFAHVA